MEKGEPGAAPLMSLDEFLCGPPVHEKDGSLPHVETDPRNPRTLDARSGVAQTASGKARKPRPLTYRPPAWRKRPISKLRRNQQPTGQWRVVRKPDTLTRSIDGEGTPDHDTHAHSVSAEMEKQTLSTNVSILTDVQVHGLLDDGVAQDAGAATSASGLGSSLLSSEPERGYVWVYAVDHYVAQGCHS